MSAALAPGERLIFASTDRDIVVSSTDRFAPTVFRADPAAIEHIRGLVGDINQQMRAGGPLAPDQDALVRLILDGGDIIEAGPSTACGNGCSCRITEQSKSIELFLLLSQYCNLGCTYCLDGDESYQKRRHLRMTLATARRALERFTADLGPRDHFTLTLFGGEPLLNWDIVPELVAHARAICRDRLLPLRIAIQTNLTFLPPGFIDFAEAEDVVILSNIDGPPHIHNRLRPHRARGADSYAATAQSLAKLKARGVSFSLRTTITALNAGMLSEIADLHVALGARESIFAVLRTVNSDGFVFDKGLVPDPSDIAASMRKLLHHHPDAVRGTMDGLRARMVGEREQGACGAAVMATPTVDSNGDIYSCAWFVGQPDRRIGSVFADPLLDVAAVNRNFEDFDGTADPVCARCDFFNLCRGGCAATRLNSVEAKDGAFATAVVRDQQCAIVKTLMDEMLLAHLESVARYPVQRVAGARG